MLAFLNNKYAGRQQQPPGLTIIEADVAALLAGRGWRGRAVGLCGSVCVCL